MPIDRIQTALTIARDLRIGAGMLQVLERTAGDTLMHPKARAQDVLELADHVSDVTQFITRAANRLREIAPRYEETP